MVGSESRGRKFSCCNAVQYSITRRLDVVRYVLIPSRGVSPAKGRNFLEEETYSKISDVPGTVPTVLYSLYSHNFDSDY
jgi:predicted CoA-binding protein